MSTLISLLLPLGVAIFVYYDAKSLGVKRGQPPGFLASSPTGWAIGCFLLLIVVLPIYLIKRVQYKRLRDERLAAALFVDATQGGVVQPGVWPPPPDSPA